MLVVVVFVELMAESLYFTMLRSFFALKIAHLHWSIWTPSNTWLPGPTSLIIPSSTLIDSAVFAGLMIVRGGQTDQPTGTSHYCICNDRPHVHTAM